MPSRRALLAGALALAALACSAARQAREPVHLVVLHTNDVHGQLLPRQARGGLSRLAAAIQRVRREEGGRGAAVIAVDAGDWYQGTPEGATDAGLPFVRALTAVRYDAMALGNHEFDHGLANLRRLLGEARVPAVAANLLEPSTQGRVDWVEPWRIVAAGGLRIGVVGLVTPSTPEMTHADARTIVFQDPVEAFARARQELAGRADLLLPVGHIGLREGEALARAFPDLFAVVTGHSHTYVREERRVGGVLVVQAGERAQAVGRIDVWIDPRSRAVLRSKSRLVDLLEDPAEEDRVAAVDEACARLSELAAAELAQVVGRLEAPLTRGRGPRSTVAGNWLADLMRARTGADVALHNRGGSRSDVAAGPVTLRDLYEHLPFDNGLVTVTLSGEELLSAVRRSIEGGAHSGLDFSGARVVVRESAPGEARVEEVEVGGRPLEASALYRVTTNSFLAGGGDGFAELAAARARAEDGILLRELARAAFDGGRGVRPPDEERIVLVRGESP